MIKGQAAIVKHSGEAAPVAPDEQPEMLHIELKLRPELIRRLVTIPPFQTIKAFENQQSAAMRCHATPGYIKITQARSHAIQQIRRCRPQINDLRSDSLALRGASYLIQRYRGDLIIGAGQERWIPMAWKQTMDESLRDLVNDRLKV